LKEEKYEIDEKEMKKYFEFESVLDYLHRFIEKFYRIKIVEFKGFQQKKYNENVKIYEIYKNNTLISYYFLDPFFRNGKRP
jgi:Zn-dependent oligopeptidase